MPTTVLQRSILIILSQQVWIDIKQERNSVAIVGGNCDRVPAPRFGLEFIYAILIRFSSSFYFS